MLFSICANRKRLFGGADLSGFFLKYTMRLIVILLLASCAPVIDPVRTAQPYIGLSERHDRTLLRDFVGVDPVRTEWCAAFVNAILELDGIPGSGSVSDVPLMARSFLYWGEPVEPEAIQRGDIVIFPRGDAGWQGHVGFYVETQDGRWVILGGNQYNEVRYDYYKPSRALGIRRHTPVDATP